MNSCVPFPDGVVLVDPDYLKDRKGTGLSVGGRPGEVRVAQWGGLALTRTPERQRAKTKREVGFRQVGCCWGLGGWGRRGS